MDKQKQIEEMARGICGNFGVAIEGLCGPLNFQCDLKCKWFKIAERCYNEGYRKIPEGAVVLETSVYESLDIKLYRDFISKQVRNETAEKFAEQTPKKVAEFLIKKLKDNDYAIGKEGLMKFAVAVAGNIANEICKEITEGKNE